MHLTELIHPDLVKVGMTASTKWEAIEELIDVLVDCNEIRLTDRHDVADAVLARERSLTTGMEYGVAIPHAAVDCVDGIVVALGTAPDGIPFESMDAKPGRLIVLLIIPKGAFEQHVRTLAGIAKLGSTAELREAIIKAQTAEEVMDVIRSSDFQAWEEQI